MTDLPDQTPARDDAGKAEHTERQGEVEAAAEGDGLQPGLRRQSDLEQASSATGGAVRAPGPAEPPAGRPGWATGVVSFPVLLGGLIVAFAATLGLASIGGWAGLAACALVITAMISLAVAWSE
jgi:hypothetical protein